MNLSTTKIIEHSSVRVTLRITSNFILVLMFLIGLEIKAI